MAQGSWLNVWVDALAAHCSCGPATPVAGGYLASSLFDPNDARHPGSHLGTCIHTTCSLLHHIHVQSQCKLCGGQVAIEFSLEDKVGVSIPQKAKIYLPAGLCMGIGVCAPQPAGKIRGQVPGMDPSNTNHQACSWVLHNSEVSLQLQVPNPHTHLHQRR